MNSNFLIFGASGLIGGHFKEACENNEKEFISIGRRYLPKIDTNKQCIINFDLDAGILSKHRTTDGIRHHEELI